MRDSNMAHDDLGMRELPQAVRVGSQPNQRIHQRWQLACDGTRTRWKLDPNFYFNVWRGEMRAGSGRAGSAGNWEEELGAFASPIYGCGHCGPGWG